MKTNLEKNIGKTKVRVFEQKVFERLSMEHENFKSIYGGYAILLSHWIKDCYNKGESVTQVVRKINGSGLKTQLRIRIKNPNR
ncbi:hypothetical protein [Aquimarina pacifica]|uniref:hypothetical protein n=1 Tax=Aquimarina pacifica TaxID=1296415 RepID=UPI0004B34A94|nr:hypothetical protein [Aquimarina pacifica]